jgi:ribonucleoside-diphosphate reductase alpha chain
MDNAAFTWLNNNDLSYNIWDKKYRYNGESFENWLDRVSGGNEHVKMLIYTKKFIFGGRILSNRGVNDNKTSLSNCYVITPPEDNIESIFEAASKLARTFSYGGGCGLDISKLRPKNAKINNAAKTTSGAVSFMDLYSHITGLISQNGRRGALMLSLDCTHPDLEEFINLKSDLNVCTKANISVKVTHDFMQAVIYDKDWELSFKSEHEEIKKTVKAKDIFMLLAKRNWEMAEPGILYWDHIKDNNLLYGNDDFCYAGVNPCAEEPLPAGGSCLLGSLNLSEFVVNSFKDDSYFDYEEFEEAVYVAVEALNDVLDEGLPRHPLQEQRDSVAKWRQIGLGITGLGDCLIKLGMKYGSDIAIKFTEGLSRRLLKFSVMASYELAKEKGCYPGCNKRALIYNPMISALGLSRQIMDEINKYGLRNSQLLTCAPCGTISALLQVSSGVEPNFAFEFNRKTISLTDKEKTYNVKAKIVQDYINLTANPNLPDYFVASHDISPIDRIKMQAALQIFIDASISSTINLPESATVEDVANIYIEAWKHGLKGVTIWRNNCQREGILTIDKKEEPKEEPKTSELKRGDILKASNDWVGVKEDLMTGCGSLHVQTFWDPNSNELREIYLSKGSTGGCMLFQNGLSRMISLAARGGISTDDILDQLKSCGSCPSYAVRKATKGDTSPGACCPGAVGLSIRRMRDKLGTSAFTIPTDVKVKVSSSNSKYSKCPACGEMSYAASGGCGSCFSCGHSKCS